MGEAEKGVRREEGRKEEGKGTEKGGSGGKRLMKLREGRARTVLLDLAALHVVDAAGGVDLKGERGRASVSRVRKQLKTSTQAIGDAPPSRARPAGKPTARPG